MNLIEQLGGYEKAKSIRDINIKEFEGDASGVTIHYMGNSIIQEDLEDSLIEYRRQHNIFEHGDKIIVDWDARQIFTVDLVFPEIRLISALDSSGNKVGNASFGRIKHATDEEIKAGKRL